MFKILKWISPVGLIAYIYYPTFAWMVDRWSAGDSYYGHGFIVPFVSLYWIFRSREKIAACDKKSDFFGLFIFMSGFGLQLIASVLRIYFLSAFSLVILLFGVVYFLFGTQVVRIVWFPIAFLAVMVPLPLLLISEITMYMKMIVSQVATYLVNAIGIRAVQQGSYIYTPNAVCLVGDPCSGLRSFLAFLCLGLIFAYISKISFWKKVILVIAGLPLAIIFNVFRVFTMTVLGEIYGMEFVKTKTVHDGGGILVFVLALACFLILKHKLEGARRAAIH
jgi:exosortase